MRYECKASGKGARRGIPVQSIRQRRKVCEVRIWRALHARNLLFDRPDSLMPWTLCIFAAVDIFVVDSD